MTEDSICLTPLFAKQAALDEDIAFRHKVTYESTFTERVLALLVELGEFANETRCFKYWSEKPASPKERILDEYADALHFFLSLGVMLGAKEYTHHFHVREKDASQAIVLVYRKVGDLYEHFDADHYLAAFSAFLNLIPLFGYSVTEVEAAYLNKLGVNYQRQEAHY